MGYIAPGETGPGTEAESSVWKLRFKVHDRTRMLSTVERIQMHNNMHARD